MRKTAQQPAFYIFAILLLLFIVAFINVWNKSMTDMEATSSDQKMLMYSVYMLTAYCVFLLISGNRPNNGIHVICLLWCLFMPIVIGINHGKIKDIAQTFLWPLLFEVSFLFVKKDKENLISFRKLFVVVSIYGTFFFLQSRIGMMSHRNIQSNTIYFTFLTLPWLLFAKGKTTRLFLLVLFTIFGVWSLKRSVMLTLVFVWSAYMLSILKSKRKKLLHIFLIVMLIVVGLIGYSYGDQLLKGELSERINREETDEGRNRLAIYTVTWQMIRSSSPESLVFGHGHYGVRNNSILEISAHNDFLEVIYDYGLFIFILYLGLWVYVIMRCFRLFRSNSELFLPYAVSLSIFLVMSMVSHLILYTTYFNYLVLFWGSIEGFYYSKTNMKKMTR